MELAVAEQLSFEVTFDSPSLAVAMSVYDTTGASPTLVSGPTAMTNISGTNTYFGKFTPIVSHSYLILKAVYTDGTFATLSPNYAQGTETIFAANVGGGSSGGGGTASVLGFINDPTNVFGLINC